MPSPRLSAVVAAVCAACSGDPDPRVSGDATPTADDASAPRPDAAIVNAPDASVPDAGVPDYPFSDLDVGCARIFDQDIVPEYHLTIGPPEWSALQDDFL